MDNQEKSSPFIFPDVIEDLFSSYLEIGRNLALKSLSTGLALLNTPDTEDGNRFAEVVSLSFKLWSTMLSLTTDPKSRALFMEEAEKVPGYFLEFTKTNLNTLGRIQELFLERTGKVLEKSLIFQISVEELELLNRIRRIYEEEVKWLYHVPQVGLSRYYQERINQLGDQWNRLSISIGQFLITLYAPVEDSLRSTLNETISSIEQGVLPESTRELYNKWIRYLEEQYLRLFKSPHFINILREFLTEIENFSLIKNRVMQDILQFLPVTTYREMDELYRELYLLKRRVNQLEQSSGARMVSSSAD